MLVFFYTTLSCQRTLLLDSLQTASYVNKDGIQTKEQNEKFSWEMIKYLDFGFESEKKRKRKETNYSK